jgi:hypothetical protein
VINDECFRIHGRGGRLAVVVGVLPRELNAATGEDCHFEAWDSIQSPLRVGHALHEFGFAFAGGMVRTYPCATGRSAHRRRPAFQASTQASTGASSAATTSCGARNKRKYEPNTPSSSRRRFVSQFASISLKTSQLISFGKTGFVPAAPPRHDQSSQNFILIQITRLLRFFMPRRRPI